MKKLQYFCVIAPIIIKMLLNFAQKSLSPPWHSKEYSPMAKCGESELWDASEVFIVFGSRAWN